MNEAKHRFFCADPGSGILSEEESKHALRVLRLKTGDKIQVIDGNGTLVNAVITAEHKNGLGFETENHYTSPARAYNIHIAIAPTKNIDRFEFFLEKATEIGISRVTPIITKNSERRDLRTDKLAKNLISAIKQSGHLFLPVIDEPLPFASFLKSLTESGATRFIAHCQDDASKNQLAKLIPPHKKVVILIGPEGDFTSEEVTLAKQTEFIPVSLGESRLRTETAGIVACHTVHLISA
jgi:16S rRNA (uracil1498-N3)-methyltransferase